MKEQCGLLVGYQATSERQVEAEKYKNCDTLKLFRKQKKDKQRRCNRKYLCMFYSLFT